MDKLRNRNTGYWEEEGGRGRRWFGIFNTVSTCR